MKMATKTGLLQVIRKNCLNCCSGSYTDVENCTSGPNASTYSTCVLWAFRLGKDPEEPTESQKEKGRKLAARMKMKVKT